MGLMDFRKVPDAGLPARLQDTALNATYAPVTGSPNYTSPAQAAGLSAALSIVFGG